MTTFHKHWSPWHILTSDVGMNLPLAADQMPHKADYSARAKVLLPQLMREVVQRMRA